MMNGTRTHVADLFRFCERRDRAFSDERQKRAICIYSNSLAGKPFGFLGYYGIIPCEFALEERNLYCHRTYDAEVGSLFDPMGSSGVLTGLAGLWISMIAEPQFRDMSSKIRRDHLIEWSEVEEASILALRFKTSIISGVGLGSFSCVWSLLFHHEGWPNGQERLEHFVGMGILVTLAGYRLGTLSVMGVAAH